MIPDVRVPDPEPAAVAGAGRRLDSVVLRLVKGGDERRAIAAGQADAILDPETGTAFLLSAAQQWLLEQTARVRQQPLAGQADPPLREAFDGLVAEVAVLDANGTVLTANQSWRDATAPGLGAAVNEGANYLAACGSVASRDRLDGITLAAGIRQVIAGLRRRFRYEHACELAGQRHWFTFSITRAPGHGAARVVVSREDTSARKRDEQLLELEYTVAVALAEAPGTEAALKSVIRAVCEAQGWECGRYFHLDPATSTLRCQEAWGIPTTAVERFLEASRGITLPAGAGLKGRVYRSGQPVWTAPSVSDAMSALALAPSTEGDGAFIFPVLLDDQTLGVLAFSGRTMRQADDRLLQAVRTIGSQVGRFLARQQAQDALRRSEARFRRLTELSVDWYWEQDREFQFTEYVGTGVLHPDRVLGKTLWALPNLVVDSADWAAHRAQLGQRWSFCDFEFSAVRADGQTGCYRISGEPVFDEAGAFTGYRGTGMDITRHPRAAQAPDDQLQPRNR